MAKKSGYYAGLERPKVRHIEKVKAADKLRGVQLPLTADTTGMTDIQKALLKAEQKQMQREQERTEAHITVSKDGQSAFFKQGDLMFSVDVKDLNNVVGANGGDCVIDKLMDSQVIALAQLNTLPVNPYVRELLRPVLIGVIQLIWYRDVEHHESDHLYQNQMQRVALYLRKLSEWKAAPEPTTDNGHKLRADKTAKWAKSYQIVAGKRVAASLSGRELQVFNVVAGLKKAATLAQIVEASKGKVETKQDLTKIVIRFIGKLVASGAVQEVKNGL